MSVPGVTRIGEGVYRVEIDGRAETVYIGGSISDRWAFWNGQVFRAMSPAARAPSPSRPPENALQAVSAPMPASVLKVVAVPGARVKQGDILVILEAMKMELPLCAPGDATVKAVHCRAGEVVQPDTVLVELE